MNIIHTTGFFYITPQMIIMWCIAFLLMYLAITREYEPLLLLPIGFGILLANLPFADLMKPDEGLLWRFYHYGIQWEVIPPLIFLGIGATMNAETFLKPRAIFIFFLGLFAFAVSTGTGILLAKVMNLFSKNKINPLLGAAGVSAVPMAARVVHKVGSEADKKNYLLMYAMGPNVAGVIGTVIAAGIFLTSLK
jgi:Na+-transporting methylmalonyl-CoA/oxaloacetate decarboxylase beta subunit